jgi:hypothetical protein
MFKTKDGNLTTLAMEFDHASATMYVQAMRI